MKTEKIYEKKHQIKRSFHLFDYPMVLPLIPKQSNSYISHIMMVEEKIVNYTKYDIKK
jgi:hypothetical protein